MKKCPYCAEEIQDEAIKCRYCGEMLEKNERRGMKPARQDLAGGDEGRERRKLSFVLVPT